MSADLDEVAARQSRLHTAVAELAELPFDELPAEVLDSRCTAWNPFNGHCRPSDTTPPTAYAPNGRLTLVCKINHDDAGPSDEEWQARRRYDEETLGQTLWYPPKSVDPSRQPRANHHHRRPKRPPEPDAA